MTKIFQKLYVPLRYKKSLPFKSGFCLHQPPGRVPFYHLPWWHLLHEGSCSVFELSKASRKSSPSYSESCSPGKAVAVSFFRKPGLDKSLAEFQRRQRGTHQGWLSDPIYRAVHSHSRVCLFKPGVLECNTNESTCSATAVFHICGFFTEAAKK